MFKPKNKRIKDYAIKHSYILKELESIFKNKTNIYIDSANVLHWQDKLGWRIDFKKLKQFLDSFSTIKEVKFYCGTLEGDKKSKKFIKEIKKYKYEVITKAVKIMKLPIDVSSIPKNSPTLLQNFISKSLLSKLDLETIEYLNKKLKELNNKGIKYIEHKKCNFDVEIGRDLLIDYDKNDIDNFILWSGDSDFADPVNHLLKNEKTVFIFATARRVSVELSSTKAPIFDIKKIKECICWKRDLKK